MKKTLLAYALFSSLLMLNFAPREKDKGKGAGEDTLYGYVTCSTCVAKGATTSHHDCMEKCLAKGAEVVLVTDDDHHAVALENPDLVRGHHADHVALQGFMQGDHFHIISVRMI
jgi:uncharacterized protein YqfA (UPF0365 family)